ncbi:MAG: transcription termination factor NusA [Oscillospiraceae bacterium]|nr:transcription termination factor NusA [Oscillospiraceae bacterium]
MIEKIEQALLAAMKKNYPATADCARVELNPIEKTVDMFIQKTVVEVVENQNTQYSLEQAQAIDPNVEIGGVVNEPVDTSRFGRIAAQAAKQVIIQGIREAERNLVYDEFTSKEHEILTGVVTRIDQRTGGVSIQIGSYNDNTEAMLSSGERIPNEPLKDGDRIKVYVIEVRKTTRGPQILISRTHPGLVKRLFELEVPEIFEGIVEIKSIAREAGNRTKIAVDSSDSDVEPIGACVGPKGSRVNAIVDELGGEKIDIIRYSDDPTEYVAAALAPSEVVSVTVQEDGKSCRVIVPDNQLSLAIGKEGQNVRLAARLTGFKIDIKPESQA